MRLRAQSHHDVRVCVRSNCCCPRTRREAQDAVLVLVLVLVLVRVRVRVRVCVRGEHGN